MVYELLFFDSLFHSDEATCPHCLRKLSLSNVRFYCTFDPNRRHEVFLSFFDKMKQRLPVCGRNFCKGRGIPAQEAVCRFCGEQLPLQYLFHKRYLSFCMLGVAGAGKSSYLTTMLHEFKYSNLPWVLQPIDARTLKVSQQNDQNVYEARHCLAGTESGVAPKPQQWIIRDTTSKAKEIPTYALTIYDGAGEDCERIGDNELDPVISRYIAGSRMFVIMFDPLLLSSVRAAVPFDILSSSMAQDRQSSAPANMVTMVNALANYIRQSLNIAPNKLIDRQTAVVITKLDTLRELDNDFGSSAVVMKPSPHAKMRGFVEADSSMVDLEIRDWLQRQGETAFLDAIDANFQADKVRVFGVSSFGQPPDKLRRLAAVTPHRVLDPIMWMLANEKIVPTL